FSVISSRPPEPTTFPYTTLFRSIGAMYNGDRSRKETLVEFGFRLPSALDNRPLRFDEWRTRARQTIYVSATPADWELAQAGGVRSEEHTSELQSRSDLVCRLLLE